MCQSSDTKEVGERPTVLQVLAHTRIVDFKVDANSKEFQSLQNIPYVPKLNSPIQDKGIANATKLKDLGRV